MALDQAANFVVDELQSSVTDTATTFSVANASQFPDPANGEYNLVVFDASRPSKDPDVEVVRVTGRDTTNNDLTVSRGQETTTATSHASGTAVELSYTAKFRDDIQTELDNAGGTTVTSIAPTEAVGGEEPSTDNGGIAIGFDGSTEAMDTDTIAIGNGASSPFAEGICIGAGSESSGRSVAIGQNTTANYANGVVIGGESGLDISSNPAILIGAFRESAGSQAVSLGAVADGEYSLGLGYRDEDYNDTKTRSIHDIAIGPYAQTASTTDGHAIAIGRGAQNDEGKQMVVNLGIDNRVLSIDKDGNLTIAGSLTENGSP